MGALDGSYVKVRVPLIEKARYRNRKQEVSVNVLAACDPNMKFTYALAGWEGSAADSRVLRYAVLKRNIFKVPEGVVESSTLARKNLGIRKVVITRRSWAVPEEQTLICALKELVARDYKCDNGFKAGYLGVLEQPMLQTFPDCELKADPHIHSKFHASKKQYATITTMLSRSGFRWNDTTNTIEVVSDEVWSSLLSRMPVQKVCGTSHGPITKIGVMCSVRIGQLERMLLILGICMIFMVPQR